MKVKVCDAIMGSGKTQAAIVEMDRCVDRRYILYGFHVYTPFG